MGRASYDDVWFPDPYIVPKPWYFGTPTCCSGSCREYYIRVWNTCWKLVHPLSYTHKANGTCQPTSKPWALGTSTGYFDSCRKCIRAWNTCAKLVHPLSNTHKANGTCQHTSTGPWAELHTMMCGFQIPLLCQNHELWERPQATLRPVKNGSRHIIATQSLSNHCHIPTRQIEHASICQQVHGQSFIPWCVFSRPLHCAKTMSLVHIHRLLWGL